MSDYRQQLQRLLKDLFQFDSADLDFGIYAIMNQKRDQIERFIEQELLDAVQEGLQILSQQGQTEAQQTFEQVKQEVVRTLGARALEEDVLKEQYHDSPLGEKYLAAQQALAGAQLSAELEAQIFNDLYQFFARYYQDGDFISQRRYGRNNKYAVPYNGEEVHLHWANFDQYYVKSGAYFTNYSFTVPGAIGLEKGASVQVKIAKVDVERDNVKGDKRFFVYAADQQLNWDETTNTLTIPMEYRPLTPEEGKEVGTRNQQSKLLDLAYAAILEQLPNNALKGILTQQDPLRGGEQDRLTYHLNRYAASNTRDFFVHKDLGGFLRRELDYYLKNEVIQLDDINLEDPLSLRRAAARSKTIREIAHKIIAFLDQIESFQRRLFLKRKFVLQSDYSLTLDKIPQDVRDSFFPEILANTKQLAEWQSLYDLTITSEEDLAAHPHVMLDTAFFDDDFKARLLATFEDIEEACDGLLVHGENFQALSLLSVKQSGTVKAIYIDPPYNSKTSEILYKNTFKHSSWLSLMADRLIASQELLRDDGILVVAIDENEQERLGLLLDLLFPNHEKTCITVVHNPRGIQGSNFSYSHEYAYFIYPNKGKSISSKERPKNEWDYSNLRNWGGESEREYGKNLFYPIYVKDSKVVRLGDPPSDDFHPGSQFTVLDNGEIEVWPIDDNGVERKWRYSRSTLINILERTKVVDEDGKLQIHIAKTEDQYKTTWTSSIYDAGTYGTRLLTNLFGREVDFSFPKSVNTVQDSLAAMVSEDPKGVILDFFAGSGTTGHATMNLNRDDNGSRKYILVEMGDYFNSVLKPRIQKVAYSSEWQNGKPVGSSGQSHMFQYIRLESYDDCYHNIRFKDVGPQQQLLDTMPDYFLSYLLEHETAGSPTLLDVQQFDRPFDYMLNVAGPGGVLEPQPVDLVTTFNFLLGLSVQTLRVFEWSGDRYVRVVGRDPAGKRVCVLWRTVPTPDRLDAEAKWLRETVLADVDYDKLYINGESALPDVLLIEEEFKRQMFEGVQ